MCLLLCACILCPSPCIAGARHTKQVPLATLSSMLGFVVSLSSSSPHHSRHDSSIHGWRNLIVPARGPKSVLTNWVGVKLCNRGFLTPHSTSLANTYQLNVTIACALLSLSLSLYEERSLVVDAGFKLKLCSESHHRKVRHA